MRLGIYGIKEHFFFWESKITENSALRVERRSGKQNENEYASLSTVRRGTTSLNVRSNI